MYVFFPPHGGPQTITTFRLLQRRSIGDRCGIRLFESYDKVCPQVGQWSIRTIQKNEPVQNDRAGLILFRMARLSLTRKQTETGPGLELLHILEEISAHGKISAEQVVRLHDWLAGYPDANLPAVAFLAKLIEEIVAHNTPGERAALQLAIERLLPVERRDIVRARRRGLEEAEKAAAKEARLAEREAARQVRERNRPVSQFNFMVAGASYEGRWKIIDAHVSVNGLVYLVREPDNPVDRNAVAIRLANGLQIGYAPRDYAAPITQLLNAGFRQRAWCSKLLTRTAFAIPVIEAAFYNRDATIEGAVVPESLPQRPASQPPPVRNESPRIPVRPNRPAPSAVPAPAVFPVGGLIAAAAILIALIVLARVAG